MKKHFRNTMAAMLVFAVLIWTAGSASAQTVKQSWLRFSALAGETLATGQVVAIKDADGLAWKAKANDAALRPAVGIVNKGAAAGQNVEIVAIGIVSGWSGLSPGAAGYLSETAGLITQSSPSFSQQVGLAISATEYLVNFHNYLDTSSLVVLGVLTGATPLVFEGATADAFETSIAVTDPTADRTITLPDRTGQVQVASAASALTPAASVALTVGLSNVYTDTVTDNQDQTITFSGAGTAGDEITIIFTTAGTADEVITFHATLVSSVGTLTLGIDAGKFYVVRFISNGSRWFEVSRTAVQT